MAKRYFPEEMTDEGLCGPWYVIDKDGENEKDWRIVAEGLEREQAEHIASLMNHAYDAAKPRWRNAVTDPPEERDQPWWCYGDWSQFNAYFYKGKWTDTNDCEVNVQFWMPLLDPPKE